MSCHRRRLVLAVAVIAGLQLIPAQAQDALDGEYCLEGVREVGSCFRFEGDGSFEYYLSYGAYDEFSEGRWRREGDAVILDSPPFDRPVSFSFVRHEQADGEGASVVIVDKAGNKLQGFDVLATCDGRAVKAPFGGMTSPLPCPRLPDSVSIGLAIMGVPPQPVPIPTPAGAERVAVFSFEPGDLGKRSFAQARLVREGDALVTTFARAPFPEIQGIRLRYVRAR